MWFWKAEVGWDFFQIVKDFATTNEATLMC